MTTRHTTPQKHARYLQRRRNDPLKDDPNINNNDLEQWAEIAGNTVRIEQLESAVKALSKRLAALER